MRDFPCISRLSGNWHPGGGFAPDRLHRHISISSAGVEERPISMDLQLTGRTAIVCGSSRGLGRACALALAAEGAGVVVNGIDRDRAARTTDAIRAETG